MLEFNPDKRPTAKMLLAHSMFDDIRIKNLEDDPSTLIDIEIDHDGVINYDTSEISEESMGLEDYRKILIKEFDLISTLTQENV